MDGQQNKQQSGIPLQPPAKSIDGVKPVPKLSGENQEHHLGEQSPVSENQQAQEPADQPQENSRPQKPTAKNSRFPLLAVTAAVVVGLSLIAIAIFVQLQYA